MNQHFLDQPELQRRPFHAASRMYGSPVADGLLQIVDGGLAGVIFLAPLLMGGRHPLGQLVLVALAAMVAVAWAGCQWCSPTPRWRSTPTAWLFVAGTALLLLQAAPLPGVVLQWATAHAADFLPLWFPADSSISGLGRWQFISLTPADTLNGLTLWVAYGLLFVVVVQRVEQVEDVERLLRWCGLAAVGMAVFGLVQFFTSNGKFFWFYQHPYTNTWGAAKGSFSNRNHFAHFLALGIGPLIWWLQEVARRARRNHSDGTASYTAAQRYELQMYLLGLALVVVVFANMLSLSRGGIAAALIAGALCTTVCYRASAVGGKVLAGLGVAGLLIGVALVVFGYDRVANRLDDFSSGSLERLDQGRGRRALWAATLRGIPTHAVAGSGVGSFHEVYPMYGEIGPDEGVEPTHSENGPLQITLETGCIGLALVLAGIGCCAWWCIVGCSAAVPSRLRLCSAAIAASLAAAVAHGLVDFVWYVPACAALVAIFAACALRVCQLANPQTSATQPVTLPRWAPGAATLVLLSAGGWMIATCVGPAVAAPHWDQYLIALGSLETEMPSANDGVSSNDPEILKREQQMIAGLEDVVRWQPTHCHAQLALAELHLRQFERLQASGVNPMSLVNVRDAVLQSRFPSREAMTAWLSLAVGAHWTHLEQALYHTHQALACCPLEGRAYVYLAELAFLEGSRGPSTQDCVRQALRVRPFDGAVLLAAGREAYLTGDLSKWLDYAKLAFRCGGTYQRRLIADLIGHTTAENVPTMAEFVVREFQPNLQGMRFLCGTCVKKCPPEPLAAIRHVCAAKAEQEAQNMKDPEAAVLWIEALQTYAQLNEGSHALQCAHRAVQSDPNNYQARYELASCLIEQKEFTEAETHLHWCLQRASDDGAVQRKLKEALQGRLDGERRAAVGQGDIRR